MKLSRQQLSVLVFATLCTAVGQSLIFAILGPLGREVGMQEIQITSIIATSALVFGLVSPWWGRYSDRVGRKRVILIGLLGYTVGTVVFASLFQAALMGLVSGLTLYLMALFFRCTQALIMSATGPASTAYAADHTSPDQRTQAMAKIGAGHSLGTILGPAVSGALATFGLLAPLFFAGFLTAVASVMTWRWLPAKSPLEYGDRPPRKKLRYSDPRVVRYLAVAIGMFTGFSSIQQTLAFGVQDTMHLGGVETAQMTGAALMVSAVFAFLAQTVLIQRLKLSPELFVRIGLASLLMAAVFAGTYESFFELAIGMAFMGTGLGVSMPSISAAASLAVSPEEQGAVAGLVASSPAIGFVAGPIIAGGLYQLQPIYASIFSAVVFASVLIALVFTKKKGKSKKGAGGTKK
jgi:MFS family permease